MKTTKKQFSFFEREVRSWVDRFGLKDWDLYVFHRKIDDDALADCGWDEVSRQAIISFATDVEESLTWERLRRLALHESIELLLCLCTGIMREARPHNIVNAETHKVIRVLERVLLTGTKGGK